MPHKLLFSLAILFSLTFISNLSVAHAEDCMHDPIYTQDWNAVVTTGARVRNIPCMETSTVITTLPVGEVVKIIASTDGYYQIRRTDGTEGWIGQWLVSATDKPFNEQITTTDNPPSSNEDSIFNTDSNTEESENPEDSPAPQTPPDHLTDINNHKYETAITYLFENKIISGYPDGTFKPDNTINRAEFLKMILNSAYSEKEIGSFNYCFTDVKNEWFSPFVCFAFRQKIVEGYSDGNFKPGNEISFVEAAKILVNTQKIPQEPDPEIWYYGYVKALEENNYIPKSIISLDKKITRGEMSEMLYRILEEKHDLSSQILLPEINKGPSDWTSLNKNGFIFSHPNWVGYMRNGWDYLSDEMKNIEGLDTKNYEQVDHYLVYYTKAVSTTASDESALKQSNWFGHPLISESYTNINGLAALRREYRASPGEVVNGRTVNYDEVIVVYTYRKSDKVAVLQYFNAHPPTQSEFVAQFEEIAKTMR